MNWRGFNCTIPHKVAVIPHLDRLKPAAEAIGAVNCVTLESGELIGDNTDGKGFLESVSAVRPVRGLETVILGAGGAARAIAVELALAGTSRLTIVNRTPSRVSALAALVQDRTGVPTTPIIWEGTYRIPDGTDLVVNATSIGLYPDTSARVPIDTTTLRARMIVCDVIPNPPSTRLIRDAALRGCTVLDGLGMLVNQGAIAIKLWSGRSPRAAIMRDALTALFSSETTKVADSTAPDAR